MRSIRLHNLHLEWLEERTLLSVVATSAAGGSGAGQLPQNAVLSDHSFTVQTTTNDGMTNYSIDGVNGGSLKIDTSAFQNANTSFTISNFSQVYLTGSKSLEALSLEDIGRVDVTVGVTRALQADDVKNLSLSTAAPPVMLLDGNAMVVSAGQFAKSAIISMVQNLSLSSTASSDVFSIVAGSPSDTVAIDFSVNNLALYNFQSISQLSFSSRSLDPNLGPNPAASLEPPSDSHSTSSSSASSPSTSHGETETTSAKGQADSVTLSSFNGKIQDITSIIPQLFQLASTQDNSFSAVLQNIVALSGPVDTLAVLTAMAPAKGEPTTLEAPIMAHHPWQTGESIEITDVKRAETVEPALNGSVYSEAHQISKPVPDELHLAITFGDTIHEVAVKPKVQSFVEKMIGSLQTVAVPTILSGDKASAMDVQSSRSERPASASVAAFQMINHAVEKAIETVDSSSTEFKAYLLFRLKEGLTPGSGNILITDFMGTNARAPFALKPE